VSTPFNPLGGLIIVEARLWGTAGDIVARLALDTGASATVVNEAFLRHIGCDPVAAPQRVQVTTGSGIAFAPRLVIDRIESLGQVRTQFPVLCHTLPPTAPMDGLLGLDFLRHLRLTIDFRTGRISLR
jgi:predicted aspartyl protease